MLAVSGLIICEGNSVTLMWVRGHVDTLGDEVVDYLAKSGAQMVSVGPETAVCIAKVVVRRFGALCAILLLQSKIYSGRYPIQADCSGRYQIQAD